MQQKVAKRLEHAVAPLRRERTCNEFLLRIQSSLQ